jgi:hypothetical protein
MPTYVFENPDTGEIIEVTQGVKDKHEFFDGGGLEYKRVWTVPNAAIDTSIDPFSSTDFVNKTRGKGCTMGDLWDASKEASQKREKITGKDGAKEKHFKDYSKKRKGLKHKEDKG